LTAAGWPFNSKPKILDFQKLSVKIYQILLSQFSSRIGQKKEAERLFQDAEKDPEMFHRICGRGLEIIP